MERKKRKKTNGSSTKIIAPKNKKGENLSKDEVRSINKQKLKKKRKIKRIVSLLCLAMSIICLSVVLVLTVFFKTNAIKVSGSKVYDNKTIIEQSNIELGSSLFSVSEEEVNDVLTRRLPYIKRVKLTRKLPDTINIEVFATSEVAAFPIGNNYVLIDETGKVLDKDATQVKDGVAIVSNIKFATAEEGGKIILGNKQLTEDFLTLISEIKKNDFDSVTEIILAGNKEFKIVYDNRITIKFGLMGDFDKKIQRAKAAIEQENIIDPYREGVIEFDSGNKFHFEPGQEEELTISPDFVTDGNGNVVTDLDGDFVTHPQSTDTAGGEDDEQVDE